jgi:hypothetical protein
MDETLVKISEVDLDGEKSMGGTYGDNNGYYCVIKGVEKYTGQY